MYIPLMRGERKANHARRICPGYRRMKSVREMQISARKDAERAQQRAQTFKTGKSAVKERISTTDEHE